ncbi:MAG: hypothetical protein EZS28_051330, partial [Streblomastix strix]
MFLPVQVLVSVVGGSLTKSYPLFYLVHCAVSVSILCGGKCGIVIPDTISSRKSSFSDSSILLCAGDNDILLYLCCSSLPVVLGSSVILEGCCYGYDSIGEIHRLWILLTVAAFCHGPSTIFIAAWSTFGVRLFVFTVGSPLVKTGLVVEQLRIELVISGITLVTQSIGR